ncbi:MAG TPA: hypothetical protein DCQ04_15550 [Actinobacteria bacterium]|nr:hypothetical protein [Actinomycetota bacterium]
MRASQRNQVSAAVDRWLAGGLITSEQAQQLRADIESRPTSRPSQLPATGKKAAGTQQHFPVIIIEALGYLGGAIVVVALGLLVSYFWSDLSTGGQLVLIAAVFLILIGAGVAVPQQLGAPAIRLRSVLWVAATIAWAFLIGFTVDNYAGLHDERMAAVAAWSSVALGLLLWFLHREPLQQIAVFVPLLIGVGVGTYLAQGGDPESDNSIWQGAAVWIVSLVWFGLGWFDRIRPAMLATALGAIGALFGAMMCVENPALAVVGVTMLAALVAAAVARNDFVLLAVAAFGSIELLPSTIMQYFPGILAAALVLLLVGLLLIVAALYIARRRNRFATSQIDLRSNQPVGTTR